MKQEYTYEFSVGVLTIRTQDEAITQILFGHPFPEKTEFEVRETPLILETKRQLEEYFAGRRRTFELPLAPQGTPFCKKVWECLLTIPYGETRTYQEIAIQAGNPKACRAVGMANNRNPIPIIVPCHRVIGKNGTLVGYAGGLEWKETLLKVESVSKMR